MNVEAPRAKAIFLDAVDRCEPQQWSQFLDEACGEDLDLRRRVEILLRAHATSAGLLDDLGQNQAPTVDCASKTECVGTTIGPYKLMEQIGEGGMGVVYVAEQSHPVRRRVALKVIKPGMDSKQVVARFEAERQALAMMDHPNIAKVFDGGVTDPGRPYFVMELVRGMPITQYCDAERLPIRDRLELFVLTCRAVQHAHQKGIIHRDLKPSNILVTLNDGVPVPKVIDFGVAKATGQSLAEKTVYTAFSQLVGTPLYMSPEQLELSGLDIDTRSDIYALGVLLYELLTGTTPFDSDLLQRAAFDEMRRILREDEPPTPSTRLSTLSEALLTTSLKRSSDPRHLNRSIRGELDWIVMKAIEKDRRRRYETASDFAADVMRHLTDQPVVACPPSLRYRLSKIARRNRVAIATAVVLAAALGLGTVVSTWQAVLARRAARDAVTARAREFSEAEKAKRAQADTEAFSDFLVVDILGVARPKGVQGGLGVGVTVAQALEAAERNLEKRFSGRPLAEATAHDAIGVTWRNLGKYEQAERHLRRAVELRERELGPGEHATLSSRNSLGVLLRRSGRYAEAIAILEVSLQQCKANLGPDHPDTLLGMSNLAEVYKDAGRLDLALPLMELVLEKQQAKLGPDHPDTLRSMTILASAHKAAGRLDLALPLMERVLERQQAKLGPDHPDTLVSRNNIALLYVAQGRFTEAEPLLIAVLESARRALGKDHPDVYTYMDNVAALYLTQDRVAEAEPLAVKVLEGRRRVLGEDHPDTLSSVSKLAYVYHNQDRPAEAEPLLVETLELARRVLGEDHPDVYTYMNNLASVYRSQGRFAEAEPLLVKALKDRRRILGEDHPDTLISLGNLAALYWSARKLERSVPLFEELLKKSQANLTPEHPETLRAMANLGSNYSDAGRSPEGIDLLERAWEMARKPPGPLNESLAWIPWTLGSVYDGVGRFADSEPLYREALEVARTRHGEASLQVASVLDCMGLHLLKQQKYAAADPLLRECLRIREQKEPDDWHTFNARSMLGASLLGQGNYAEAEPLLLSGYDGLKQREGVVPTQGMARLAEATEALVHLYESTGDKDKAAQWREKLPVAESVKPAETRQD